MNAGLNPQVMTSADLELAIDAQENVIYNQPSEAQQALLALRARAAANGDHANEAYALLLLSGAAVSLGDYVATLEYAQACVALADSLSLKPLQARALNALGIALNRLGQMQEAIDHFARSLELALELGDDRARARVLINLANIYINLEDYGKALELYQEGRAIALACGAHQYATDALRGSIESLEVLGRDEEALALVPIALQLGQQHNMSRVIGDVLFTQGKMLLKAKKLDGAWQAAQAALVSALGSQDKENEAAVRWLIGEIELAQDNLPEALEEFAESERLCQGMGHRVFEARVKGSLAALAERQADYRQAVRLLRQQREIEQSVRTQQVLDRAQAMAGYVKLELLRHEAEAERHRNEELEIANSILQQTQVELTHLATHDNLTGVVNRSAFWKRAQRVLETLDEGQHMAVVFADIDLLKAVNDRYGHAAGDHLILTLAQRLRQTVRTGDLVGRLSGDEFMILLSGLAHPDDIELVTQRLLSAVREPLEFEGQTITPSMSMGCVVAPLDGSSLELLHKHADLAMYHAKNQGRNMAVRFKPHMSIDEQERRQLEHDLRAALQVGGLQLHYQGQYLLPARQLYGFEALVRWPHPQRGMLPPFKFIPLAEESQLIVELDLWVLNEACRQARAWNFGASGLVMSVNVSARLFDQENFVQAVRDALERHGLPGKALVLELTESMVHHNPQLAAQNIEELRSLGVRLAMDDFGTGYSSLSMLKNLPFQHLKIDRAFLLDLNQDSPHFDTARHFLEIIVGLAHHLNMRVVAEGVETEEQLHFLGQMGCDKAQGYFLARPCQASQAEELLPE